MRPAWRWKSPGRGYSFGETWKLSPTLTHKNTKNHIRTAHKMELTWMESVSVTMGLWVLHRKVDCSSGGNYSNMFRAMQRPGLGGANPWYE